MKSSEAPGVANAREEGQMQGVAAVTAGSAVWEWYGHAAHFCCGHWCRFHMATKVGPWLVSTVGEYVHPRHSGASEKTEAKWLKDNYPGEDIGYGRKYETMVFKAGAACECGCGLPTIDGSEVAFRGANTAADARANHMAFCAEYALKSNIASQTAAPKTET